MPCVLESLSCEHTLVQSFFCGTIFAGMATSTIQKYSSTKLPTDKRSPVIYRFNQNTNISAHLQAFQIDPDFNTLKIFTLTLISKIMKVSTTTTTTTLLAFMIYDYFTTNR